MAEWLDKLKCSFGVHDLDESCQCKRCVKIVHRYKNFREWVPEEGVSHPEGLSGPPWIYDHARYKIARCCRCGYELKREGPIEFRGPGPWT